MPTTALYHWNVAGSPIQILIDLAVVDQLRVAAVAATNEIGGILLGHFDGRYTVITALEKIESEHRRGTAYTLSQRDEARLGGRLETLRRKNREAAVGYFRSHQRPGLFLDEGDNHVLSLFFPDYNNVALLVRPSANGSAVGGFFFWEDGEINRKQTYLPFPMNAHELESGDFPLMEPVQDAHTASSTPSSPIASDLETFSAAETMDHAPRPAAIPPVDLPDPYPRHDREADTFDKRPLANRAPAATSDAGRRSWQLIGVIAAAAAFGGYLIGTSGSHRDRFGARAGDITLNSDSDPLPASPAPSSGQVLPSAASRNQPAPAPAASTTAAPPPVSTPAPPASSFNQPQQQPATVNPVPGVVRPNPTADPSLVASVPAQPRLDAAPRPDTAPVPSPRRVPNPGVVTQPAARPPVDDNANWQHFHPAPPTSASQVAESEVASPDVRPVSRPVPAATSSVYLESVESGGVGRAISRIPLFGRHAHGGADFTPPQAVRSSAPSVPNNLARELSDTLPVDLRLKVNSEGRVSSVEVLSHQTPAEFVRLAGDAAYDWQFQPARVKDKAVASDVIAHFKFRPPL